MNCLITLNINNKLCDNSRESMIAASKRWNCSFYEITENYVGNQNVCFNKIVGIKKYCEQHDVNRLYYIDADILIRIDTPNPFDIFTGDKIYAVRDVYDHWDDKTLKLYRNDVTDPWIPKIHEILQWDVDVNKLIQTCSQWFFNAGAFIICPTIHMDEIDIFISHIPTNIVHGRIEQTLWNYILKIRNKVELIDYTWNRISPPIDSGTMKYYMYHFTGLHCELLKKALPIYDWKTI